MPDAPDIVCDHDPGHFLGIRRDVGVHVGVWSQRITFPVVDQLVANGKNLYDQSFTPWFLDVTRGIPWKNKHRLQIPALVPKIFKFEKCV